jgi:hypothetical protein
MHDPYNVKFINAKQTKQQQTRTSHSNHKQQQFYPKIKFLTSIEFTKEETELLSHGLQYCIEKHLITYFTKLIIEMERNSS